MSILSIGDLVDKLVIENLKLFSTREELHQDGLSDEEYVNLHEKMQTLNKNRSVLIKSLDAKLEKVVSGLEKNRALELIKTYKILTNKDEEKQS